MSDFFNMYLIIRITLITTVLSFTFPFSIYSIKMRRERKKYKKKVTF